MRPYKRRQFIVDKEFQVKFIMTFVIICVSGMAIATGLFNYLAMREIENIKWKMVVYENTLADLITPHIIYLSIFAVMFTVIATVVVSWYLTWKVAGPIYRMKKDIEKIEEGNLSGDVRLRRSDAFKETAGELDNMMTAMRVRFRKINTDFKSVKKIIDTMKDSKEDLLKVKCEQLLHNIETLSNTLKGS